MFSILVRISSINFKKFCFRVLEFYMKDINRDILDLLQKAQNSSKKYNTHRSCFIIMPSIINLRVCDC